MAVSSSSHRTLRYQPALAWFAALGSAWVFVLVMLGAFTTTIGAGMAFPDWPLSNGSLNPHGWLDDVAMFAEHSHRLSGAMMGLITIALTIWLARTESRSWVRKLGWSALAIVVIQGVIGGQRVRMDAWHLPGVEMSVGQLLRIPHGILAQIFVIVLFSIAAAVSRPWMEGDPKTFTVSRRVRQIGLVCTLLVLVQLVIAATMRHFYAGLAIPTFPLTPEGTLIPTAWNFRVGIHFAHRAMAAILGVALIGYAMAVWTERSVSLLLKNTASLMVALLALQIALGIAVIWTVRDAYYTTGHVMVGAITFAVTFLLTWFAHRNALESKPDPSKPPEPASAPDRADPSMGRSHSSPARS